MRCAVPCCALLCCAVLRDAVCCATLCPALGRAALGRALLSKSCCCSAEWQSVLLGYRWAQIHCCHTMCHAMCHAAQTEDPVLLLEAVNPYRRAIQYQQLEKLQHSGNGSQGFYVQVRLHSLLKGACG